VSNPLMFSVLDGSTHSHKVIVVGHQAGGITHRPHVPTNVTESLEKDVSALLVQGNICPSMTTRRDMLHRLWKVYA
jgi:hypothetical protein